MSKTEIYPGPNWLIQQDFPGSTLNDEMVGQLQSRHTGLKLEYLARDINAACSMYQSTAAQLLNPMIRGRGKTRDLARTPIQVMPVDPNGEARSLPIEQGIHDLLLHRIFSLRDHNFRSISIILESAIKSARAQYEHARLGWVPVDQDPSVVLWSNPTLKTLAVYPGSGDGEPFPESLSPSSSIPH